jgi:hypothetical protein
VTPSSAKTPKHRVLKRFPEAYAYQWAGPEGWVIYASRDPFAYCGLTLNLGAPTAAQAWAAAAKYRGPMSPSLKARKA